MDRSEPKAPEVVQPSVSRPIQEGPRATFAAVKPPSLALPPAGGAMRSIGETFQVSPATGTASASLPLPLTPAPRGPMPAVSLGYDSGSGNGLCGHGWALSVPQIVRRSDHRLPTYLDSQDADELLFAGEVLVPHFEGATRDERDVTEGAVSYRVERYRPRIEAAFTLLERWRAPDGSVHFRAHAADNSRSTFGTTAASRIADPRDERRVYAWLLDETRDDRGHVVSYHYVAEDLGGVPTGLASERARREGRLRFANKHLKRIRYANATPHDASSYRLELVLDYGDHDPEVPSETPSGPWLARQDPSSTHRPGFDLRSYRLLRRALMFHRFSELGDHRLVRSLDLGYAESPKLTQLVSATIVGYSWAGTTYARQELPSVTLGYTAAVLQRAIATIPRQELRDLEPTQLNKTAQWVDLDGEGLPGVLTQRRGAHHYKPNRGGAQLGPGRLLDSAPNLPAGGAQLMDLDGGGDLAMVRLDPRGGGYQERTRSGWGPFRTFAANPGVDFGSPHLKMVDLNGDGADDLLLSRGDHLVWYPSLGKQGWGAAQRIPLPDDPKRGPALIFGGVHSSVFLADMTGDGLQDLVRIGHSQVVYWPNQGHGRFGAQIVMDACPRLERPDRFHPTRVRLADLDGTGTADLLYFHARGVSIYLNQAGNRWSEELRNESIPVPSALPSLAITDLHGTGMATLTWAGSPQCHPGTLRHTTPFGTAKPYLLATIDNGMGLTRTLSYGSSTAHYLRDQRAGRPWPTKLPFPVQVLDRVDTRDAIAGTRLVTRYRYSHGYYDPQDRELRGFGLVETEDAETFAPGEGAGSFPELPHDDAGDLAQPPVLTKTWFHTGAFPGAKPLQDHYDSEAWRGDPNAPGPLHCDLPTGLSPEELRQAHRALKGTQLRQEIYGTDDLSAPYQIREAAVTLKRLQPARPSRSPGRPLHPIYQLLPRETREHHYDRIASDPRVTQWCALAHDPAHGFVTQDLTLAYARRSAPHAAAEDDPELADLSEKLPEQTRVYALATETDLAHTTSGGYRIGVPLETRVYEITGLSGATVQTHAALLAHYESAEASTLTYHQAPTTGPQRRLIERVKLRYLDSEDLPDPLPFGEIDARALLHQAYRLDLTDALLDHHELDTLITSTVLSEAGYVTLPSEDGHWIPSGTSTLDPAAFYLPTSVSDPFGNTTTLTYDADNLLVDAIEDPLGNTLSADHDYRLLAPKLVTDINGNRTTAAYDDLGRITAIALMGQAGAGEGDTLASPTQDFEHHTTEWTSAQRANYIRVRARRTHGGTPSWQTTYLYSDGSGRIALVKTQAEPGLAPELDEDGNILLDGGDVVQSHADPRWVGSGRTLFNNKGNPVKQYEPYFSRTHTWDTDPNLHHWGITPILHYDPTGRLVRTDHPDGSYEKTTHGTWKTQTWDRNDTLDDEANRWRQARETLPTTDPRRIAYDKASAHAATPSAQYLDPLGRPILSVAHHLDGAAAQYLATRTKLDLEGHPLSITDPLERLCQTHAYSIAGQLLRSDNIDSGIRHHLATVLGEACRRWDARDQRFRPQYDDLRRPTHLFLKVGSASETLLERRYYGDAAGLTDPQDHHLRGKLIALYDGAGLLELGPYDFKANLLATRRQLTTAYTSTPDWSPIASEDDVDAAKITVAAAIQTETFEELRTFDALNRITSITTPDDSLLEPLYNEASLLEALSVYVRGATTATPIIKDLDYNAKGQRTRIEYSDDEGTAPFATEYHYDELTFRLKRLTTTRVSPSNTLQTCATEFDPVGNIIRIQDDAQQSLFYDDAFVAPENLYTYDAVYRLIEATGREHASIGNTQLDHNDQPIRNLPLPTDPSAVRSYLETYTYDRIGNLLELFHSAGPGANTWTRTYAYVSGTNQLASNTIPGGSATYTHDAHGSITSMPHLASITYGPFDQMQSADLGGGGDAYYQYDASGQRVRKLIDTGTNLIKERIYLGAYEIYREHISGDIDLERQSLHVMDGTRRVAVLETLTIEDGDPVTTPVTHQRFQLGNHLDSALLEVDETGLIISYEEYHPYGTSAYRSARSGVEVSARRYRYTGKERDDETGLYY
ncbi:MAG: toxin, partial [Polyangiaceae bacterium]|nr:toxin [Polyangiaceae bacterium]